MLNLISKTAIIIPTKDRVDWCHKILSYYDRSNYGGYIVFADSSSLVHYGNLGSIIADFRNLNILHVNTHKHGIHKSIEIAMKELPKEVLYVVQSGDDDFFDVDGVLKCVLYLQNNPSFKSVFGKAISIGFVDCNNMLKIKWVRKYWQGKDFSDNNKLIRLENLLTNYINLEFAVKKKNFAVKQISYMNKIIGELEFDMSTNAELASNISTILGGKSKFLKTNYLFRGDHAARPNNRQVDYLYNWLFSEKLSNLQNFLIKIILNNVKSFDQNKSTKFSKYLLSLHISRVSYRKMYLSTNRNNPVGYYYRFIRYCEGTILKFIAKPSLRLFINN